MAISGDGNRVVSGGRQETVNVWDADQGPRKSPPLRDTQDSVTCIAISGDGKRVVSGSKDKTIKVWDADNGQEIFTLKGHPSKVTSVAISSDGKRIVSGSGGNADDHHGAAGEVKLWDAESGKVVRTIEGDDRFGSSVATSADGKSVASGSTDGRLLLLWDADSGREILSLKTPAGAVGCLAYADGKRIVIGGELGQVLIWDAEKNGRSST